MKFGFWELVLLLCICLILFGPTVIPWVNGWLRRANQTQQRVQRRNQEVRRQMAQERDAIAHRFQVVTSVLLIGGVVGYTGYLFLHPVTPAPQPYTPVTETMSLTTAGTTQTRTLDLASYKNPVCVTFRDGWLYAAVDGNQIIRIREDGTGLAPVFTTESPVTSMVFGPKGSLFLMSQSALYQASFDGWAVDAKPILTDLNGAPLGQPGSVVVDEDGRVYFTQYADFAADTPTQGFYTELMAHTGSGSVWMLDPQTNNAQCIVRGLSGAGGLALSPDGETLYVSETNARRVWAVPADTRDGEIESAGRILLEGLDGYAAGLYTAQNGDVWVAVCGQPIGLVDSLSGHTLLRRAVLNLPHMTQGWLLTPSSDTGWTFCVADDGSLTRAVAAQARGLEGRITGVWETDTTIWLANADGSQLYGVTR